MTNHIWNKWGNGSIFDTLEKELPQSTFYWLLISIVAAIAWVIYLTYYNSRILGIVLTAILNKFVKYGHVQLGSFSISVLSGKIMFRDVHIITEDFSLRIQLGLAIFRWWRPLAQKEINEDLSHQETRLSVYLDSFELHVYNQSAEYAKLEKLFGLDQLIVPPGEEDKRSDSKTELQGKRDASRAEGQSRESKWEWRDLVPVIKFEISSGRLVFGNYLVPTTLSINIGDAHVVYTTKPASTPFDHFMHVVKCKVDSIRMMLVPSPKYNGIRDEPPRFMGDGFVILQSNDVDIYYYHDEPGLVPYEPELVQLANGDVIARRTWPCWGMDVKCGKGTDLSYGPWADRQREYLYKFFYPASYEDLVPTKIPEHGERRMWKSFDFKMSVQNDCTFDVLFSKQKETQALHMNCRQGSYLEFTIPWVIEDAGYMSRVNVQLMHLDATTSLQFRSLIECETFEVDIEIMYPRHWNEHQLWKVNLTACKASGFLIFHHKVFFMDMIEDWSTKSRPDLYHYVPYTWRVGLLLKEFELITLCNESNWIHCFGQTPENSHIAFCGDTFDMTFNLPFVDFLPVTVPLKFFIRGESVDTRLYLPETNTSRHVIQALSENMRIMDREGNTLPQPFEGYGAEKWRRVTLKSDGWTDVWTSPIVAISICYVYHPCPATGEGDPHRHHNFPVSTPEAEEMLLTPLRLIPLRPLRPKKCKMNSQSSGMSSMAEAAKFDPTSMKPDEISVELEVGPSVLCVYGTILRCFLHLKENYFGVDQKFTDFSSPEKTFSSSEKEMSFEHLTKVDVKEEKKFDPRHHRPMHVKVQLTLHDIQAHLIKNCNADDPPCPSAFIERIGFEMDKRYEETKLQVLVSPAVLIAKDHYKLRPEVHSHLGHGHLALSGLQVRGHAMFSHECLPLEAETLEYAWLVEVSVGDLTGKLTAPQLQGIIESLQTFVFLVEDSENALQHPVSYGICQHGVPQPECPVENKYSFPCPTEEELKYRLTRCSVDCVDLYLTEAGSALNVQVFPIRVATCNLHGKNNKSGITCLIPQVNLKQFVLAIPTNQGYSALTDVWLEAGGVCLGPINVDAAMALPCPELFLLQDKFLKTHDNASHRLWFLWSAESVSSQLAPRTIGKCGCRGGCVFFGNNRNGPSFFEPSEQDFISGTNSAIHHICVEENALGYAQSLLQKDQFMFDLPANSMPVSRAKIAQHTAAYMSKDSTLTRTVTPDDLSSKTSTLVDPRRTSGSFSDRSSVDLSSERTLTDDHRLPLVEEMVFGSSVPSDYLPDASVPDTYDTDRTPSEWSHQATGSFTSLPEMINRRNRGHERNLSLDPPRMQAMQTAIPRPVSLTSCRKDSKNSLPGSTGTGDISGSRHSSLTSPVLRRLSSQLSVHQEGSSLSVISSDKYFSATEEERSDRGRHERSDSTSTDSVASFVSAVSSQRQTSHSELFKDEPLPCNTEGEETMGEDYETEVETDVKYRENFVDLHGQMNHQITRSPLLIGCYMSHMTKLKCSYWSAPPPLPNHQVQGSPSSESGTQPLSPDASQAPSWIPEFAYINEGFTPRLMVSKPQIRSPPDLNSADDSHDSFKQKQFFAESDDDSPLSAGSAYPPVFVDDDGVYSNEDHISKTTAIVNLKGSVDIMFSPLMLEALQRYLEAVTPILSNLHPSAVVDTLHFQCSAAVKAQNKLKQEQSEVNECTDGGRYEKFNKKKRENENEDEKVQNKKTSQLQLMFSLSKINISILQASLTEEQIAFHAIDRVKELTCVSVLAACLDSIQCRVLINNVSHKTLEPLTDSSPDSGPKKPSANVDKKQGSLERDAVLDQSEMVEKQQEDIVGSLSISRIHCQLRRMKKDSNFSDFVHLTAIPEHRSKVLFTFQKQNVFQLIEPPPGNFSGKLESLSEDDETAEDIAGFIMFECGLEDINLKAAKRSGYEAKSVQSDDDSAAAAAAEKRHSSCTAKTPSPDEPSDLPSPSSQPTEDEGALDDDASRASVTSNAGSDLKSREEGGRVTPPHEDLKGDASSCVLEFKTVWFNFAAPPPSPKKKKLEFTRMDWNLLSTMSPGINAWMNPCHRAIMAARILMHCLEERISTVMACIMTEGLEVQGIHLPVRSKFNKITALSRTLQEDPSCQLLTVLRRYIHKVGVDVIEHSLSCDTIPQLLTIQKGLLALTRQWKNTLYMPILADINFKNKKKAPQYTVTFQIPQEESLEDLKMDDEDITVDNFEVIDEKTSLLKAEEGSLTGLVPDSVLQYDTANLSTSHTPTYENRVKNHSDDTIKRVPKSKSANHQHWETDSPGKPGSQRSQSVQLAPPPPPQSAVDPGRIQRNESATSFHSLSTSSVEHLAGSSTAPGTPLRQSLTRHLKELASQEEEDLYRWMQRQQESTRLCTLPNYPSMGQDSLMGAGVSEYSQDDSMSLQSHFLPQGTFQQDAQVLFKPLLKAIGLQLEAIKMSATMKKFGGNVSIRGVLQALRVDIVDSEKSRRARGKRKAKKTKFHIDTGFEMPAFLCDTFSVSLNMKDMVDFEKDKEDVIEMLEHKRRSMRFSFENLEAKPTTTCVNFSINCHSVTQHVNMSLLRLVHQFVTMIENVNTTRIELKAVTSIDAFKKPDAGNPSAEMTATSDCGLFDNALDPSLSISSLNESIATSEESSIHDPTTPLMTKMTPGSRVIPGTPQPSHRPDRLILGSSPRAGKKRSVRKSKLASPLHSLSDSAAIDMADTSSPALAEKTIVDEIKEHTPKCWRDLYHLLDLYASVPDAKTINKSRLSVIDEEPEKLSQAHSLPDLNDSVPRVNKSYKTTSTLDKQPPRTFNRTYTGSTFTQSIFFGERIPLVVFGLAKVKRIRISAMLSGLKLEADLQNVHASATHRERVKGVLKRKSKETSLSAHVGHTMIVLLEGLPPQMQTVVTVNVSNSEGLYSSSSKKSRELNSCVVCVGMVDVDIPQHPVVLHGMVARSSKRISTTLQEFIRLPTVARPSRSHDTVDGGMSSQPNSDVRDSSPLNESPKPMQVENPAASKPFVIYVKAVLKGLAIGASLLPSLKAVYRMDKVTGSGITGKKARFNFDLPTHSLSFTSKFKPVPVVTKKPFAHLLRRRQQSVEETVNTPSNLPSSASIALPPIHVHADYLQHKTGDPDLGNPGLAEDLTVIEGSYLDAVAEVGTFEHSLSTDLLNHLVFVQKVFMKEVNEVVQKVSGSDQPISLFGEETNRVASTDITKPLLYSFLFRLKGIQITATTPTNNAVRLETESIELKVSNRVQHASRPAPSDASNLKLKVFVEVQVDLNLALGTLIKNPLFEEVEDELQHLAWFKTVISLRNALQDEMISGASKDQEALLISCKRPVVCVQPAAFDKAVLVWLNYKNAYEYWNEQRLALNKEVQTATQQVIEKLPNLTSHQTEAAPPPTPPSSNPASAPPPQGGDQSAVGTLFLQLTVEDVGICLPMNPLSQVLQTAPKMVDEAGEAMVLTLESTQISACSYGSLVSTGKFTGFCLRFADDFEVSWDDWKPHKSNSEGIVMNALVVPDGTYEVCSRTINALSSDPHSNAKWILNIKWAMQGIEIHLDTNIGKRLSVLGDTLNVFYGEEEEMEDSMDEASNVEEHIPVDPARRMSVIPEGLPDFVDDPSIDPKTRARLIEKEMNEKAKYVDQLKQAGVDQDIIQEESRKLQDLQTCLFWVIRQGLMKKLKKQGEKATALRDKLGLGYKPAAAASRPRSTTNSAVSSKANSRRKEFKLEGRRMQSCHEEDVDSLLAGESPWQQPKKMSHQRAFSLDVSSMGSPRIQIEDEADDALSTTVDDPTHVAFELESSENSPDSPIELYLSQLQEDEELILAAKAAEGIRPRHDSARAHSPQPPASTTSSNSGGNAAQKVAIEPNVDFILDVKVMIDSGYCVLHPKQESEAESKGRGNRTSPRSERRKGSKKANLEQSAGSASATRLLHQPQNTEHTTDFFLPSLDVKVHYSSKTSAIEGAVSPSTLKEPHESTSTSTASSVFQSGKKSTVKKLYAWVTLQQLSEEMLISPSLLDFLEQALEPIPITILTPNKGPSKSPGRGIVDLDTSSSSLLSSGTYATYATSLPIDVVVYIMVKPSLVRFTCLPVSRVECLLRLPSVDVVFSSYKAADSSGETNSESTPPTKAKSGLGKRLNSNFTPLSSIRNSSTPRLRGSTSSNQTESSTASSPLGGINVTARLSDFSLFIFHPYTGGQKNTTLSNLESAFRKKNIGNQSPLGDPAITGRKDSLSLNVEFVKVNISRSRKGVVVSDFTSSIGSSSRLPSLDSKAANHVRVSAVCDIGSASFKYDMRRLSEILCFPKAWYRRKLARRLFLGEEMAVVHSDEEEADLSEDEEDIDLGDLGGDSPLLAPLNLDISGSSSSPDRPSPLTRLSDKHLTDFRREFDASKTSQSPSSVPQSPSEERHRAFSVSAQQTPSTLSASLLTPPMYNAKDFSSRPGVQFATPITQGPRTAIREWETMVLFAVNLSELDVTVNMSNLMGNVMWSTKNLKSQGCLSIDSAGYKNMQISTGVSGSKLEARGGIVGGNIELQGLGTLASIVEDPSNEPEHKASAQLHTIELRLDYMGSSILMARVSKLAVILTDYWKVDSGLEPSNAHNPATSRPTEIYVNGDLGWDKLHMMISRSTTPDIVKMANKLEEFFTQQVTNSKRVFTQLVPLARTRGRRKNSEDSWLAEVRHHRHWQRVMEQVFGCKLAVLSVTLPKAGVYLGGSMTLHGKNLSLACFHGINFRSKSWALFTMEEPYIRFTTDATDLVDDEGAKCTHIIQSLIFQLGHNMTELYEKRQMATICRLSRGHHMPPPFTSVADWFHYAFATDELKNLDVFPQMGGEVTTESPTAQRRLKRQEYNHDTELIFVLPSLQMTLETHHLQGETEPREEDPRPVVECSFITQFEDHIFVAMDAEVIFFLHDLVTNYVREKDNGAASKAPKSPEAEKKNVDIQNPTSVLKQDLREFYCKTWCLEPTVRLLAWAGKRIDPVGIDYILQKLGFQHARLTIPKWMQRGCMDPLDKVLSLMVERIVVALREEKEENKL